MRHDDERKYDGFMDCRCPFLSFLLLVRIGNDGNEGNTPKGTPWCREELRSNTRLQGNDNSVERNEDVRYSAYYAVEVLVAAGKYHSHHCSG